MTGLFRAAIVDGVTTPYPDFEARATTLLGKTRMVFRQGSGPAVIVMHEIPCLYPGIAQFGRLVARAGFTVYLPSLLGTPGEEYGPRNITTSIARSCVAKEFATFATRRNSPITRWLRALARRAHEECGGPGVGAIGMCLTGGFALAMMADERMLAPVLSQPSLPFPLSPARRRDLGIDDDTLAAVKARAERGACVLGLRFSEDWMAPPQRFARLAEELGDAFIAVEIDSSRGNPHNISRLSHSVLVHDFVDKPGHPTVAARQRVLDFLKERLPT